MPRARLSGLLLFAMLFVAMFSYTAVAAKGASLDGAEQGPRVLIIYDMEGVSGIDRESYTSSAHQDYAQGRKWLTSDVNAAIRGLKAGGAGAIWVQDGHGSGNSAEPDILLDQMDSRATFDFRDRDFDPYSTGLDGSLSAIVCIAMHAANTAGFLAHTYTLEPALRVNGVAYSSSGSSGRSWAHGENGPGKGRG